MKLTGENCKCAACGERFESTGTFEKHRIGAYTLAQPSRPCLSVQEMLDKGMRRNSRGAWVVANLSDAGQFRIPDRSIALRKAFDGRRIGGG